MLTHVLKVSEDILADATAYFAIYCFGLVFQFAYNIVSFILRSLGDSAATLYFLLVSSVTNIVLDLVFVICLHWDVPGRGDCHGDCPGVVCGGQRHLYVQTLPHSSALPRGSSASTGSRRLRRCACPPHHSSASALCSLVTSRSSASSTTSASPPHLPLGCGWKTSS